VRIGPDGVMTIPDFAGNLFFNTLGNFLVNPKGGLVFPDWETGGLLQLTGDVEVILRPRSKTFRALSGFGGSNRTRSSTGPMLYLFAGPLRQRAGRQTRC
jgi:Pyridoxamine 5'-phosphate oxidase